MGSGPIIQTLDIETAPPIVASWTLKNAFIGIEQVIEPGYMLGFGHKQRGKNTVGWVSVQGGVEPMVTAARDLLDSADLVITYNGDSFDLPRINADIAILGLTPPSRYKSIDLYRTVKRRFRFDSHKLDYVAQRLGVGKKASTGGWSLWQGCMNGDPAAWAKMGRYCRQDVRVTEALHDRILPWIPNYPNLALWSNAEGQRRCPNAACGSPHLQRRGQERTTAAVYPRYQCQACGGWSRGNAIEQRVGGQNRPA